MISFPMTATHFANCQLLQSLFSMPDYIFPFTILYPFSYFQLPVLPSTHPAHPFAFLMWLIPFVAHFPLPMAHGHIYAWLFFQMTLNSGSLQLETQSQTRPGFEFHSVFKLLNSSANGKRILVSQL